MNILDEGHKYQCAACGNDEDFHQGASVSCDAVISNRGEFQTWSYAGFEDPDWDDRIWCSICGSSDIIIKEA